jgi:hypothetical protein
MAATILCGTVAKEHSCNHLEIYGKNVLQRRATFDNSAASLTALSVYAESSSTRVESVFSRKDEV